MEAYIFFLTELVFCLGSMKLFTPGFCICDYVGAVMTSPCLTTKMFSWLSLETHYTSTIFKIYVLVHGMGTH